ncbi:MAG: hypothetical protein GC160_00795 [Acidobacteria bacterium]|nr:hypothetical protein [Acidobacteriota bacterium]
MPNRSLANPRVLPGLLIIALGVILLAHNFGYISLGTFRQFWPLLLVAFGLQMLFTGGSRPLGAALAIAGAALQLDSLGWITLEWRQVWRLWPAILIAIGLGLLLRPARRENRVGGAMLVALGAYFLAANFRLVHFALWDLWPVAIIVAGVMMIRRALGR